MSTTIAKNETHLPLVPWKFVRGENKDKEFLAPKVEPSTGSIHTAITFIGAPIVANLLNRFFKSNGQEAYHASLDPETGELNMPKFIASFLENVSSISLKKKELQNQKDELTAELLKLVTKLTLSTTNEQRMELQTKMAEISGQIAVITDSIERKSRAVKPEVEEEPAIAE